MQQPRAGQLVRRCERFLCCPCVPGDIDGDPLRHRHPRNWLSSAPKSRLLTSDPAGGTTRGASFSVRAVFGSTLGLEGATTA
jgi:hypothetical protein